MEVNGMNSKKWLAKFPGANATGIRSATRSYPTPSLDKQVVELGLEHESMDTQPRPPSSPSYFRA